MSVSSFVMSGSASLSGSDHIAVFLPSPIHTYRSNPFLTSCIYARLLTTPRSGLTFRGRFDLCRCSSVLLVRCYRRCWCLDNSMIHNDMTVPKMLTHHRMVPYRKRGANSNCGHGSTGPRFLDFHIQFGYAGCTRWVCSQRIHQQVGTRYRDATQSSVGRFEVCYTQLRIPLKVLAVVCA